MPARDVLFVHTNFPAQFVSLAGHLVARGLRCAAVSSPTGREMPGVTLARWATKRGSTQGILPEATRAEADLIRARAAAEAAFSLKRKGFAPGLVIGHPGWGETLHMRELFPEARQILYGEFYYRSRGADIGFDPEFSKLTLAEQFRVNAKNATMALALTEADAIVAPTPFQAGLLPSVFRPRVHLIHEGVDTDLIRPRPDARLVLPGGRVLDRSVPVVTFVNRNFEPQRGYHVFMRALPAVLAAVPDAEVVLIGADGDGYGQAAPKGRTWRQIFLDEVKGRLDPARLHFLGRVPHATMLDAVAIGRAHVYYTAPFVLSWSLLEAMASEAYIVASDTPPLHDAVEHGRNGVLLDFFDVAALSEALIEACRHPPERTAALRQAARETILARFDRKRLCDPAWLALVDQELARAGEPALS